MGAVPPATGVTHSTGTVWMRVSSSSKRMLRSWNPNVLPFLTMRNILGCMPGCSIARRSARWMRPASKKLAETTATSLDLHAKTTPINIFCFDRIRMDR